jgi:hypothetical protein
MYKPARARLSLLAAGSRLAAPPRVPPPKAARSRGISASPALPALPEARRCEGDDAAALLPPSMRKAVDALGGMETVHQ